MHMSSHEINCVSFTHSFCTVSPMAIHRNEVVLVSFIDTDFSSEQSKLTFHIPIHFTTGPQGAVSDSSVLLTIASVVTGHTAHHPNMEHSVRLHSRR